MASSFRAPSFAAYPEYYDRYGGYSAHYGSYKDEAMPKKRKLMNVSICIDHLRGICTRGHRCDQLHADHIPDLDDREELAKGKFCHDFQNRGLCSRSTCRFLHVTRREEDEFLLTGNISQTIFERSRERAHTVSDPNYSSFVSDKPSLQGSRPMQRSSMLPHPRSDYYPPPPSSHYDQYDYDYYGSGYQPPPPPPPRWGDEMSRPPRKRRSDGGGGGGGQRDSYSFSQPVTVSNFCIDHLKGNCSKGKDCRLDHSDIIEDKGDRDAIVKTIFCHDYLNKRCPRSHCKYLHANYDEQKFFLDRGFFSDTLSARNKTKLFFCDICIDYLKSQCVRGSACQHRHVDRVESKDERICLSRSIFCHDFQEGICSRSICKLFHTGKGDEELFIESGCLPEHLCGSRNSGGIVEPSVEELSETVCRDFLKGVCNRGVSCKYYHPSKDEARRIMLYHRAKRMGGNAKGTAAGAAIHLEQPIDCEECNKLKTANEELGQRVQRLENLLSDACHCITVAVGDQNPAIQTLLQTISSMNGGSSGGPN